MLTTWGEFFWKSWAAKRRLESYRRALEMKPGLAEAADNLTTREEEMGVRHNLVTVAEFSQAAPAYVAKGLLEAEGIWAVIADEYVITANWLYSLLAVCSPLGFCFLAPLGLPAPFPETTMGLQ